MKVGKSVWGGEDLQESLISVLSVLSQQFHAKHLFFFQLHVQILCSMHVVSSEVLYCVQKYCYRQFSSNAEAKVIFFFFGLFCNRTSLEISVQVWLQGWKEEGIREGSFESLLDIWRDQI